MSDTTPNASHDSDQGSAPAPQPAGSAAEPAPAATPATQPMAAATPPAPARKRRFPWVPVLASLAGLQFIGIVVLVVVLLLAGTELARLQEETTAAEATISEQQAEISGLQSATSRLESERDTAEAQLEVMFDFAIVYEECLDPLVDALIAYEEGDQALGDRLYDEVWADDGPCPLALAYLYSED